MSDDPHAPTSAGPQPDQPADAPAPEAAPVVDGAPAPAPGPAAAAEPEPTPVVPPAESSWRTPPGSAAPLGAGAADRPEVEVGLAFAGGLAAAVLLKVITR